MFKISIGSASLLHPQTLATQLSLSLSHLVSALAALIKLVFLVSASMYVRSPRLIKPPAAALVKF